MSSSYLCSLGEACISILGISIFKGSKTTSRIFPTLNPRNFTTFSDDDDDDDEGALDEDEEDDLEDDSDELEDEDEEDSDDDEDLEDDDDDGFCGKEKVRLYIITLQLSCSFFYLRTSVEKNKGILPFFLRSMAVTQQHQ